MGYADAARPDGLGTPSRPTTAARPSSTARFSTTCCTTPSATMPPTAPEVDLVLDPEPPAERIAEVLGRYRFRDVTQAYQNLMALARRRSAFFPRAAAATFWRPSRRNCSKPSPPRPTPTPRWSTWTRSATRWAAKACCGNCSASTRPACSSTSSFAPTAPICRASSSATRACSTD